MLPQHGRASAASPAFQRPITYNGMPPAGCSVTRATGLGCGRDRMEPEAARQRRQNRRRPDHGEACPDADTPAAAKGQKGLT
jgi:hypothetical protein